MKKTLSLFLAALMVFTSLFAMGLNSFAADNSISVVMDKSSYKVGEIATAEVVINANKISGLGIRLKYDADVYQVVSASSINTVDYSNPGMVNFTWASGGDTNFENKVIFTVKFKVLSTVPTDLILEFFSDNVLGSNDEDLSSSFALHHKTIFPDASYEAWYYPAVKSVAQKGYITGYSDGSFGPVNNIQRQDFVVILARIAGADLSAYEGKNGGFSDVKRNAYYSAAVAWARAEGIVNGYSSDYFGVGTPISREQICIIFCRYLNGEASGNVDTILARYPDGRNTSPWAKTSVAWAVENGIVGGAEYLNPTGNAGRAEMAQMLENMSKKNIL